MVKAAAKCSHAETRSEIKWECFVDTFLEIVIGLILNFTNLDFGVCVILSNFFIETVKIANDAYDFVTVFVFGSIYKVSPSIDHDYAGTTLESDIKPVLILIAIQD